MPSKKVVFFFPAFSSQEATAPLGILAVSTPLLRAGYQVRIIDSTITPNFQKRVLEEIEDALCLAVSLVTGPMIRETVEIARSAKELYPEKPVILGGWHPSLLPDQTLAAEYVDIIVKGQGEDALLEIVQRIEAGESLAGMAGAGYKEDGRIVFNAPRALKPIRELPPKAYHLADFDAYERVCGTALGNVHIKPRLPLQLRLLHERRRLRPEVERARRRSRSSKRQPTWSRATGSRCCGSWTTTSWWTAERAVGIAEGLVRKGVKFDWSIQASTNLVTRFTVEELKLLRRAGLVAGFARRRHRIAGKCCKLMNKDVSEDRDHLRGSGKAHAGGHPAVVQHDLRLSRRRQRTSGANRFS